MKRAVLKVSRCGQSQPWASCHVILNKRRINYGSVDKESGVMGSPKVKLWEQVSWVAAGEHARPRKIRNIIQCPGVWRGGRGAYFCVQKMMDEDPGRNGLWGKGLGLTGNKEGIEGSRGWYLERGCRDSVGWVLSH